MTKWVIIVILTIFILSISLFFIISLNNLDQGGKYISIQIAGVEERKITFNNTSEKNEYDIKSKFGSNTIEVNKGKVRVIEASCPDKLDVKQGYIKNVGEIIVCMPNNLIIEIKSDKNINDIDTVNY